TNLRDHLQHLNAGEPQKFESIFGSSAAAIKEASAAVPLNLTGTLALSDKSADSERSLELLVRAYTALSENQPVVVAIDDLHMADESSLDFLLYLTGASSPARMLFIFTAQSQETARPDSRLSQWLDRLSSRRQLQRIALEPLSSAEIRILVEKIFDPAAITDEAVAKLRQVTEAKPVHVV